MLRMWGRSRAVGIAAAVIAGAGALAFVSASRAGSSADGSEFTLAVHPEFLTAGKPGFAVGRFTAAPPAPGTGSATNVSMTFVVDADLVSPVATSTGCTTQVLGDGSTQITCQIGTLLAGQTVKRFVRFTASTNLGEQTVSGQASFDKGNTSQLGGNATITDQDSTTIVAGGNNAHPDRAGDCDGSALTPPVSSTNPLSTDVSGPDSAPGLPCAWVFVGENPAPATSNALTGISFFGFPETAAGTAVTWIVTTHSLPVPFPQLKVKYDPNYENGDNEFSGIDLAPCVNGELGSDQAACLKELKKVGRGAVATILTRGSGGDPGVGMG